MNLIRFYLFIMQDVSNFTLKECDDALKKVEYQRNDFHQITYISNDEYNLCISLLCRLRQLYGLNAGQFHRLSKIFATFRDGKLRIRELDALQPRLIAQKYIGKKEIRQFIFSRDNYKCLRCFSEIKLTIDHVIPISLGGGNEIDNLQTLCKSCNSKKGATYKDFRNGKADLV